MVGRHPKGLRDVFRGVSAGSSFIRVEDMDADPMYGTGPEKLRAQGCQADNEEAVEATEVWGMGLPTTGDSDGGGGF